MKARGFTALELALVITISSLVVASAFLLLRAFEGQDYRALAEAEAARGMRAFSEELRRDLRTLRLEPGSALALSGPCGRVEYTLQEGSLLRKGEAACGAPRAVSAGVASVARTPLGVEVTFARVVDVGPPLQTQFLLALESSP
jgi:type II secretory pathway pseudopilin PulG